MEPRKVFKLTDKFKLTEAFIEQFKGKQPNWGYGVMSYVVYKRTYARIKPDGTKEEFWETCKRVVEGTFSIQMTHCSHLGLEWNAYKAQKSAQEMFKRMWDFKWSPPGRGLWTMGTPIVEKIGSAALNNCGFITTEHIDLDPTRPFTFLMDFSMLGVGIGFDTKGSNKITIKAPKNTDTGDGQYNALPVYIVPDTREGWVEATKLALEAYLIGSTKYQFDYSQIRPAGTLIKSFGGLASGPQPLIDLIDWINDYLGARIGQKLSSVGIVDIQNNIGKCVVSGNIRRSAEIAIGDYEDKEFVTMKDPVKHKQELMDWRWASNNSIFAKVGMDYSNIADAIATNGEPGIVWPENIKTRGRLIDGYDDTDADFSGLNPCTEQVLESEELCCLVEDYPAHHENLEDFLQTLKYAYLYAKTVTLVPTHDAKVNAVLLRNRRIGCSMSGIEQAKTKFGYYKFYQEFCNLGFKRVVALDKSYSRWLCVPQSKRRTSVKPSGTVSILAGAFPGVHYPESEYIFRLVRFAAGSRIVKALSLAGYRVEPDIYNPKNSTVVYFPIHEKGFERTKYDVTIWEQMENVNNMQKWWADNAVSATVTFKKEEAKDIKRVLEAYETKLKNVSMLPLKDNNYEQAPYIAITKEQYEEAMSKIQPVDYSLLTEDIVEDAVGEKYCDGTSCTIEFGKK